MRATMYLQMNIAREGLPSFLLINLSDAMFVLLVCVCMSMNVFVCTYP